MTTVDIDMGTNKRTLIYTQSPASNYNTVWVATAGTATSATYLYVGQSKSSGMGHGD
jgi:hypothetical protein